MRDEIDLSVSTAALIDVIYCPFEVTHEERSPHRWDRLSVFSWRILCAKAEWRFVPLWKTKRKFVHVKKVLCQSSFISLWHQSCSGEEVLKVQVLEGKQRQEGNISVLMRQEGETVEAEMFLLLRASISTEPWLQGRETRRSTGFSVTTWVCQDWRPSVPLQCLSEPGLFV